jgi:hypothetical protein
MRKITKNCPICAKKYTIPYCHRKRYKTCSYKCGGIYRMKNSIKNICKNCKIEFISKKYKRHKQSFCNRECSIIGRKNGKTLTCKMCNISFYCPRNLLYKRKYCTNKCRLEDWNEKSIKAEMPGSYRQNAWKVYEKKCYDCGIIDERILVIHHVDGNRKNGKISNLIPVCHNCHCIRHIILTGNHRIPSYRGED